MAVKKKVTRSKKTSAPRKKTPVRAKRSPVKRKVLATQQAHDRKLLMVLGACVVVAILYMLLLTVASRDTSSHTSTSQPTPETSNLAVTMRSSAITDGALTIDSYDLSQPGFIVVHLLATDGTPGGIIGKTGLIQGKGGPVQIELGGNQKGKRAVLIVYYDTGDGRFTLTADAKEISFARAFILQ